MGGVVLVRLVLAAAGMAGRSARPRRARAGVCVVHAVKLDLCQAVVVLRDDHWGRINLQCELPAGHVGSHATELGASEPVAVLSWGP